MSEQRLIDANAFKECWNPGVIGDTLRHVIDDRPTIDPEALPIVRELRAEIERLTTDGKQDLWAVERKRREDAEAKLERVTAERDKLKENPPVEIQADSFTLAAELARVTAERDSYKIFFEDITKCGDCNDCGKSATCEFVPKVGQTTRYNCPLWTGR